MGIWSPSLGALSVSSLVSRCVENWLGCASAEPNRSGDLDRGRAQFPYQCLGDEDGSTGFYRDRIVGGSFVPMSDSDNIHNGKRDALFLMLCAIW